MAFAFRWLWRLFLGLLALGALCIGGIYYLATRSLPDYDADHLVAGPRAEIEIVRDERAVPHIFAKTEFDAFYGLGFVHAQDRLWQMELRRRIVQGRSPNSPALTRNGRACARRR